jgi:hypothetical protein
VLLGWYRRLSNFLFGLFSCPVSCVADVFDDFACIVCFFFVGGQSGFVVATISDTFLGVVSRLKWDQR